MKQLLKIKQLSLCVFITVLISLIATSCHYYGKHKQFKNLKLYYTTSVNETEVDALGNYLTEKGWADGESIDLQLNKTGNTYEVKIVAKKGIEQDPENIQDAKNIAASISETVFHNQQVDIHFCDNTFNTIRVVPMAQ